jgi:hypothetical protein
MEIPYGKREFIVEEEEQLQPQPQPQQMQQPVHPVITIDEPTVPLTQENCHAPPHKMVIVQEQHPHVHLLVGFVHVLSRTRSLLVQAMQENHEPLAKRMKTQEAPSFYGQVSQSSLTCRRVALPFDLVFRSHLFLRNFSASISNFDDNMCLLIFCFVVDFSLSDTNKRKEHDDSHGQDRVNELNSQGRPYSLGDLSTRDHSATGFRFISSDPS